MLNKLAILTFLTIAISIPRLVFATSGACSYHGGVNCSSGADWDGSVICNDGWRDSGVLYSSMLECNQSSCMIPAGYWDAFLQMRIDQGVAELESQSTALEKQQNDLIYEKNQLIAAERSKPVDLSVAAGRISIIESQWNEKIEVVQSQTASLNNQILTKTNGICMTLNLRALDDSTKVVQTIQPTPTPQTQYSYSCGSYGPNAILNTTDNKCYCEINYYWNSAGTSCEPLTCVSHASPVNNQCVCNFGYIQTDEGACVDYSQSCRLKYGEHSYGDATSCYCSTGYQFNFQKTFCIENPVFIPSSPVTSPTITSEDSVTNWIQKQIEARTATNTKMVAALSGRILLQTQEHGEAWYLDPVTKRRYYMKDGEAAYQILRRFGLGITDTDLNRLVSGNLTILARLKGKIVLQVQSHGEAYYIMPTTGKATYLKDGSEAYRVMRELSLGISNLDINQIPIGE